MLVASVLAIWLVSNVVGTLWTYRTLTSAELQRTRLQPHTFKVRDFNQRLPLIALNLTLLAALTVGALLATPDLVSTQWKGLSVVATSLAIFLVADDFYFYFYHRALHGVPWLYRTIHRIHHRAHAPLPLEYIYVHPLEWMLGALGIVFGGGLVWLIFGQIDAWAFLAANIFRNGHEMAIHSGFRSKLLRCIPLLAPNEHHDLHHAKLRGNYASTFLLWDRLFATVLPDGAMDASRARRRDDHLPTSVDRVPCGGCPALCAWPWSAARRTC